MPVASGDEVLRYAQDDKPYGMKAEATRRSNQAAQRLLGAGADMGDDLGGGEAA